jgi:hypothetical protein
VPERYFNREQEEHMKELAKIPREERCKCGWYRLGQCPHTECKTAFAAAKSEVPTVDLTEQAFEE